uniref:Uncharacterized protein n=2 Tax=viral metagenome TaxID=1070528 RepID=A0A6M3KWT9_9ZZZZ
MKPYMGYSREGGSIEGAVLIFAHNIKEAKRIGFNVLSSWITDEYTDMAVRLIKNGDFLFEQVSDWSKDKLAKGIPHVVDNPPSCKECGLWGSELNENGLCEDCQDYENELVPE